MTNMNIRNLWDDYEKILKCYKHYRQMQMPLLEYDIYAHIYQTEFQNENQYWSYKMSVIYGLLQTEFLWWISYYYYWYEVTKWEILNKWANKTEFHENQ